VASRWAAIHRTKESNGGRVFVRSCVASFRSTPPRIDLQGTVIQRSAGAKTERKAIAFERKGSSLERQAVMKGRELMTVIPHGERLARAEIRDAIVRFLPFVRASSGEPTTTSTLRGRERHRTYDDPSKPDGDLVGAPEPGATRWGWRPRSTRRLLWATCQSASRNRARKEVRYRLRRFPWLGYQCISASFPRRTQYWDCCSSHIRRNGHKRSCRHSSSPRHCIPSSRRGTSFLRDFRISRSARNPRQRPSLLPCFRPARPHHHPWTWSCCCTRS
jgi:hypothetical protein